MLFIILNIINKLRRRNLFVKSLHDLDPEQEVAIEVQRKGIGEVLFTMKKQVYAAKLLLKFLSAQPTFVRAAPQVYKYFELSENNLPKSAVSNILVRFKVSKSWLSARQIPPKAIVLKRYDARSWQELPTKVVDEDSQAVYFEAKLPSFSYYAITVRESYPEKIAEPLLKKKEKPAAYLTLN